MAEVVVWWAGLTGLWLVLVSTLDPVEVVVGACAALVCAVAARSARRAVRER